MPLVGSMPPALNNGYALSQTRGGHVSVGRASSSVPWQFFYLLCNFIDVLRSKKGRRELIVLLICVVVWREHISRNELASRSSQKISCEGRCWQGLNWNAFLKTKLLTQAPHFSQNQEPSMKFRTSNGSKIVVIFSERSIYEHVSIRGLHWGAW